MMETLTATFKVVTPMFMSGADQTEAELRVPSIKGALRFWWRALAWAKYEGDLPAIHRAEAKLFGSANQNVGQSKMLMKVNINEQDEGPYTQVQSASEWGVNQWQNYTGYGLVDKEKRRERQYIGIPANSGYSLTFDLVCIARNADSLLELVPAVQIMGLLGNLGGRARKGWGSVTLTDLSTQENWLAPGDVESYKNAILRLISKNLSYPDFPTYSAFSKHTRVSVCGRCKDAAAAQRYLGELYMKVVKDLPKDERKYFGFPRFDEDLKIKDSGNGEDERRRASPIFLHVHQCPDGGALPIVLFLDSTFLMTGREYSTAGIRDFLQNFDHGNCTGDMKI